MTSRFKIGDRVQLNPKHDWRASINQERAKNRDVGVVVEDREEATEIQWSTGTFRKYTYLSEDIVLAENGLDIMLRESFGE